MSSSSLPIPSPQTASSVSSSSASSSSLSLIFRSPSSSPLFLPLYVCLKPKRLGCLSQGQPPFYNILIIRCIPVMTFPSKPPHHFHLLYHHHSPLQDTHLRITLYYYPVCNIFLFNFQDGIAWFDEHYSLFAISSRSWNHVETFLWLFVRLD